MAINPMTPAHSLEAKTQSPRLARRTRRRPRSGPPRGECGPATSSSARCRPPRRGRTQSSRAIWRQQLGTHCGRDRAATSRPRPNPLCVPSQRQEQPSREPPQDRTAPSPALQRSQESPPPPTPPPPSPRERNPPASPASAARLTESADPPNAIHTPPPRAACTAPSPTPRACAGARTAKCSRRSSHGGYTAAPSPTPARSWTATPSARARARWRSPCRASTASTRAPTSPG